MNALRIVITGITYPSNIGLRFSEDENTKSGEPSTKMDMGESCRMRFVVYCGRGGVFPFFSPDFHPPPPDVSKGGKPTRPPQQPKPIAKHPPPLPVSVDS